MDADEFFSIAAGFGQAGDGQRGGVGGEEAASSQQRLGLLRHLGLELAVLEHRFYDQVAALQVVVRSRGLDAAQNFGLCLRFHAALVYAGLRDLGGIAFAGICLFLAHVFQYRGNALAGLAVGNARTHHAGAQQAYLGGLEGWHTCRAAGSALDRVQVEKEGVDHGLGLRAGHELGEVAALDTQRGLDVDLQALDHAGHDGFGGREKAARLFLNHRGGYRQHLRNGWVAGQAAGYFVALGFPGVLGSRVGSNPGQASGFKLGHGLRAGCHQVVHQAQAFGLGGAEGFAFHQIRLRTHQAQVTRHLGHTAGAGQQAQRHFGQAELGFAVVNGNAVVAD